jgi:CubicO group peptidase (beta-lactamase class C family)
MNLPFHVLLGSQSSALMCESADGVSSRRTRQYSGSAGPACAAGAVRPAAAAGGAVGAPRPADGGGLMSSAAEIVTLGIDIDRRLAQAVGAAEVGAAARIAPVTAISALKCSLMSKPSRRVIMDPGQVFGTLDLNRPMVLLCLTLAVTLAAAWAFLRLRRIAVVGAAYKAKVLCSIVFGTGRSIDPQTLEEVAADTYWLLRLFESRVDREARTVTARLWSFPPRTASYRDMAGATLALAVKPLPLADAPQPLGADDAGVSDTPWQTSQGPAALDPLVAESFREADPRRHRRTRAILIAQNGRLVAERYAPGFDATTRFPGWSMTKSVLNALIGILVGEERLSLTDRGLMPNWDEADPRSSIALHDLLRMRSGLLFSEVYEDLGSDVIEMLFNRADTAAFAANRRLGALPGTVWNYSSGTSNILSAIARRIVGEPGYPSWPRRALFGPLGMASAIMEPDASGTFVASSFMLATARDWARFGQLYLQDGVWGQRRLLPRGWVSYSTTQTPQSPGLIYGAHWWLGLRPELGGGTAAAARIPRDAFFAVGHEGQVLTVIPSLRLVVVRLGLSIHLDAWNHASFLADLVDVLSV